jgi:hypothetical protein
MSDAKSALGHKRTWQLRFAMSALPPKRTQIGQLGFIDCLPIATVAWAARATGC